MIEVELPKELHEKKNYAICVEMEEKEPIFEELKG